MEDTCAQKRRLEDGREGGQWPKRTVEPQSSSSSIFPLQTSEVYSVVNTKINTSINHVNQKYDFL